ncbi:carbamoyltransferase C-terminal domain-containing protein [Pasteurella testudinis]|uniref:carbamoyltransferase C-terminal domain-containing protein n=1 Tax=Pasteurella testudinis TaxID=761 RepID=UPI0040582919
MLILGITNNDVARACLIENDKILSAVHEERFSRIKNHKTWPKKSIDYILKKNGKNIKDIDIISYGWHAGFNEDYCLELYIDRILEEKNIESLKHIKNRILSELRNDKEKRKEFDNFIFKNNLSCQIDYIDHHDSHAWGAYIASGFKRSLVITCDGRGDYQSFTSRIIDSGEEKIIQRETSIDSLGYFYGRITKLLGFTPNKHEGKITGLAAHGDPVNALPLVEKMINESNGRIRANCGDYFIPSYNGYSTKLLEEINNYSKEDIAAATQYQVEKILTKIISEHTLKYNIEYICLADGLFGNVRLNQKIFEVNGIKNIFILPCMGDCDLPLASAMRSYYKFSGKKCEFKGMDLGTSYDDNDIKDMLSSIEGIEIHQPEDISGLFIELLKKQKIIGVIRGKMEFGPRALCKRSIIYPASDRKINQWLNKKLNRTEFMPFAPVTTTNLAPICFYNWQQEQKSSYYMTITYNCKNIMIEKCPAVVHVDNTARPQVVDNKSDPFMFKLVNDWYKATGQPALVNTSFNRHEEPIIDNPLQAISVLKDGIIDAVFINDKYLVLNKDDL